MVRKSMRANTLAIATILGLLMVSGCQSSINGQVLPSNNYLQDDVSYFPSGPEFKLPAEAAALKAAREQEKLQR